ncbi:hypothetical protein NECAME_02090 [Necator americanus]|uniref:Uncharacterized protein n=1 Tax=Necator americanus TaxID=51031 RepID=W2TI87_NECAM|nr:hypothetical protein NECAME_02090 [Necator americanus]ETN81800.1 hypothetical protein NECAME_02090 [Necator americanus]
MTHTLCLQCVFGSVESIYTLQLFKEFGIPKNSGARCLQSHCSVEGGRWQELIRLLRSITAKVRLIVHKSAWDVAGCVGKSDDAMHPGNHVRCSSAQEIQLAGPLSVWAHAHVCTAGEEMRDASWQLKDPDSIFWIQLSMTVTLNMEVL